MRWLILLSLFWANSLAAHLPSSARGPDLSGTLDGAGGIGGLLGRTDGAGGSGYYFANGSGNISLVVNAAFTVSTFYLHEPFGELAYRTPGGFAEINEMEFSSMPSYRGVVLYHARAYSPHLQRFTSADPIGFADGINLHAFVGNDPVNRIDPWGEEFRRTGGGGFLTPSGPMGYLTGDTAAENLASGAYNMVPAVGNTIANAVDSLLTAAGMAGDFIEQLETSTVGKDGSLAIPLAGGGIKMSAGGLKMLGALSRAKCVVKGEGIYEFTGKTGKSYVGQSGNIEQRLQRHIGKEKLPEENIPTVKTTEVLGGKTAREITEQKRLNQLGGPGKIENIKNPIGPKRQHLLKE